MSPFEILKWHGPEAKQSHAQRSRGQGQAPPLRGSLFLDLSLCWPMSWLVFYLLVRGWLSPFRLMVYKEHIFWEESEDGDSLRCCAWAPGSPSSAPVCWRSYQVSESHVTPRGKEVTWFLHSQETGRADELSSLRNSLSCPWTLMIKEGNKSETQPLICLFLPATGS